MTVIDLCAGGAGGFEYAAREIGLDPLGIELDDAACRVREAAGFRTLQADISALDPLDFAPVVGLVGGVPCPAFSTAGKGIGRAAIPFFLAAIKRMSAGESIDPAELDAACKDETAHLVLEPLRWALALRPRWIAQEQVEPVLPLWQAMATVLRAHGYSAWAGVVSAETFGTPQTRRRAILLASLEGPVSAPVATHQRYIAPKQRKQRAEVDEAHGGGMLDVPAQRIVHREDCGLLPWVSMAQALQRPEGPSPSPSPSVTAGGGATGGIEVFASKGARGRASRAVRFVANANANACVRDVDEPAPTITAGHDSGERVWLRAGTNDHDVSRPVDEPAPTIRYGNRMNDVSWVMRTENFTGAPLDGKPVKYERPLDEPSPTVGSRADLWEMGLPALWTGNFTAVERDADGKRSKQGSVPYERPATEPAPTVATGPGSWVPAGQRRNSGPGAERDPRGIDEPSYTVRSEGSGSHPSGVEWVGPTHYDRRQQSGGEPVPLIDVDRPAPPLGAEGLAKGRDVWVTQRPATTVNADPRISEPGHHDSEVSGSQQANAVRVSIEEAAILQGFPPGHPWMAAGSKTAAYRCVGNAIPPQMARAALLAVGAGAATQSEEAA